jgi:predicted dehydrogenase
LAISGPHVIDLARYLVGAIIEAAAVVQRFQDAVAGREPKARFAKGRKGRPPPGQRPGDK